MTKLALAPMLAILPLLLLVSACGPMAYIPIEVLGTGPAEDPALRVSAVEAELRIGREGLEVSLHNPGPAPVRIDWGQASFTGPTGAAHSLVSSARLAQLYRYSSLRQSSTPTGQRAFMPGSIAAGDTRLEHRLPSVLERETGEISVVLKAGESIREVLYPAEHVRVGDRGELWFGSLFCGRGLRVGDQRTFTIRIPVRTKDQWKIVTLAARLR